jgi:hypothetical protein
MINYLMEVVGRVFPNVLCIIQSLIWSINDLITQMPTSTSLYSVESNLLNTRKSKLRGKWRMDDLEKLATLGTQDTRRRQTKLRGKWRMDNLEKLATLGTQDEDKQNWGGNEEWTCLFVSAPSVFPNVYLSCVLCTLCRQFLWLVYLWVPLRCSLTFICSVSCVPCVASFSGLSISECPFGVP